jgi:Tol biopolymer transport system component
VFLDRLDDPALPEQLWVNPEGNILHLAVNQMNGTLYFAYGVGGGAEIMASTPERAEPLRFTTNPTLLNQTPALDPETGRVYFSRLFEGSQDIYRANPNATGLLRITTPGGGGKLWPAISPDGTRIAWSQDLGEGNTEIFTANVTGANAVRYTFFSGGDIAPHWISSDRLAWTRNIAEGNAEVLAADWPSGADQEVLTLNEDGQSYSGDESQPGRSCLAGTVLVRSDHAGKSELFVVDDGGGDSGLLSWMEVASADESIASAAMRCR